MTTILHIDLDAVDRRLRGGELWAKGWGEPYDPESETCLHGAIRFCSPVPGDANLIEQVGRKYGFGVSDNDDANSWADIRAKVVPDITDEMLAETFGPQWAEIVALVRRAAVLTDDEVDRMDAAWVAAWDDDEVDRMDAALDAALDGAGDAAWFAAGAAAKALAVRNLIGQHGFTQAHYDLLTGPWRQVIGPVHPDDEVQP